MSKNKNRNNHPLERDSKAIRLFTKVREKQKGKFVGNKADSRLDGHDDHESHLEQLNKDAVKSLQFPAEEIERREYGYDLSGKKGLNPDYYQGG